MDRNRYDTFTQRARKVLSLAQEEAQRFQHNYIGAEHLLLGLVREGEGVAAKVLSNLGVELNKVRDAVEAMIGRGDPIVLGELGLTPRAKKVIELAVDEAHRLNHHYIGTEHLLLGLVREGEGSTHTNHPGAQPTWSISDDASTTTAKSCANGSGRTKAAKRCTTGAGSNTP